MTAGPTRTPDGGRYRFESRIATGGMGEVWRATDQVLGREVAVKLLKPEYADDPTFRSRFETEARNAAALHHPNVAAIFDFGELPTDGGPPRPYLVMELVRGEPLSALLRGEPMPAGTAADLVAQAADGIAAAHDLGIVHRDVKPANLIVTPDRRVKITDFGIARAADAVALTQTGQVIGTPQYLSPEQAEGKPSTGASDIYSLGVVLYECLAGRRPFEGDSPIATALSHLRDEPPPLPSDVPPGLREIVATALAKDPAARFANVRDFAAALRGGPVRAGDATTTSGAPTRVAGAAAAGAALGAAGAAAAEDGTRVLGAPVPGPAGPAGSGGSDGSGGPGDGRDDRRRRGLPPWLPWAVAAVAVLAAVLVLTRLTGSGGTPSDSATTGRSTASTPSQQPSATPTPTRSASPTPTAPTTAAPATVTVTKSDYVGRPKADARRELEALGLNVDERPAANPGDQQKDTVADVSPTGKVAQGSTVTLSVYGDPVPPTTATPSVTPTLTPSVTPSAPGKQDKNAKKPGDTKGSQQP